VSSPQNHLSIKATRCVLGYIASSRHFYFFTTTYESAGRRHQESSIITFSMIVVPALPTVCVSVGTCRLRLVHVMSGHLTSDYEAPRINRLTN